MPNEDFELPFCARARFAGEFIASVTALSLYFIFRLLFTLIENESLSAAYRNVNFMR
jgi:hypothetical protein